jgi:hypothetical protein
MFGAFRATRVTLDARNLFTKKIKFTQTRKRNARLRNRVVLENAAIIREGREALAAVNARLIAAANAPGTPAPAAPSR